jgi:small subunit ribosomal protein S30e
MGVCCLQCKSFCPGVPFAGKVHGSLARAGKVRGQTPKVEKQDKKKLPKGRAMKRIKYNRRFVNVGEWPAVFCPQSCCCSSYSCFRFYFAVLIHDFSADAYCAKCQWWASARRRALTLSKWVPCAQSKAIFLFSAHQQCGCHQGMRVRCHALLIYLVTWCCRYGSSLCVEGMQAQLGPGLCMAE